MKVQVPALPFGEPADFDNAAHLDAHPFEGGQVCHWRDHQPAGILEADETAVKQVIDAGRQQQAVFAAEPFFVG